MGSVLKPTTDEEWRRGVERDRNMQGRRGNPFPRISSVEDSLRYGTIDALWSTGPAPVTLSDGVTHITAFVSPSDPDVKPGALVSVREIADNVWVIETVYGIPIFPKWVDLTLATGWTWQNKLLTFGTVANGGVADAPFHKVQVTKTSGNFVDVAGTIVQGASATTLITTLPVGYRPLVEHYFVVATISAAGVLASTGIKVLPDGTVNLQGLLVTGAEVFLDGVNFTNDAALAWTTLSSVGYQNSWTDVGGAAAVGAVTVDSNFRVFLRGKLKRTASTAGANNIAAALPSQFRVDNAAGSNGIILRGLDPGIRVARFDALGTGVLLDSVGGTADTALDIVSTYMSQNYPGLWTNPAFFVGADYANNYPIRAYTKTPDGMVQWRGLIASNTGGKNVTNLSEGYRPAGVRGFAIETNNTTGLYFVAPDGATYFNSGVTWQELNQIRFVAEK